jgi:hypothetical protein
MMEGETVVEAPSNEHDVAIAEANAEAAQAVAEAASEARQAEAEALAEVATAQTEAQHEGNEELRACQTALADAITRLDALQADVHGLRAEHQAQMAVISEQLQSIQSPQENSPAPNPENPESDPAAVVVVAEEPPEEPKAEEPKPVERKRAHRWI